MHNNGINVPVHLYPLCNFFKSKGFFILLNEFTATLEASTKINSQNTTKTQISEH